MIDVEERKFLADVLGKRIVPSFREVYALRLTKTVLINEGLISSVCDIAPYCDFARIVFAAREFGGDSNASTVAASTTAQFVTWGFSEMICRRVAALQGISFP